MVRTNCWPSTADTAVAAAAARLAALGLEGAPIRACRISIHALAVQARPDQVSQFQTLAKSTAAARKQAEELLHLAGKENNAADFSKQTAALKDAVEEVQGGNESFVKSFSKSQKSGLKELTKKLQKADSEVGKQRKALDQQLGRAKGESAAIAGTADKLEKALTEFQTQQVSLGKEMGIETPAM